MVLNSRNRSTANPHGASSARKRTCSSTSLCKQQKAHRRLDLLIAFQKNLMMNPGTEFVSYTRSRIRYPLTLSPLERALIL